MSPTTTTTTTTTKYHTTHLTANNITDCEINVIASIPLSIFYEHIYYKHTYGLFYINEVNIDDNSIACSV